MNNVEVDANKVYLITGAAGFIGYFLSKSLLEKGCRIVGIDSISEDYDVDLKNERIKRLNIFKDFAFIEEDIAQKDAAACIFKAHRPDVVIHLAAQPGVRNFPVNANTYIHSNIIGFYNILEACRQYPVTHLIYASSSSVYGLKETGPFFESDFTDEPISLYAATKKSNELAAHAYSCLYKIPATGLRLFTVYGPLGRPDMAYFRFANKYFSGAPITIFKNDDLEICRDFIYIDDVVEGIERILAHCPTGMVPHHIYNIGSGNPQSLSAYISQLEKSFSEVTRKKVVFHKQYQPVQPGDVSVTHASIEKLKEAVGFVPKTTIEEGLRKFAAWYVKFYDIN